MHIIQLHRCMYSIVYLVPNNCKSHTYKCVWIYTYVYSATLRALVAILKCEMALQLFVLDWTCFTEILIILCDRICEKRCYTCINFWVCVPQLVFNLKRAYMRESLNLITYSQMKLCLFKVAKSDACIRPFCISNYII